MAMVEVDVDLDDFDTSDLLAELRRRARNNERVMQELDQIIEVSGAVQLHKSDFENLYIAIGRGDIATSQRLVGEMIYKTIGRLV